MIGLPTVYISLAFSESKDICACQTTMSSNPSRPLDIIVVGGGLAGLAVAGYLRQHNVTVKRSDLIASRTILNAFYCLSRFWRDIRLTSRRI
jgi:hypothetical protein